MNIATKKKATCLPANSLSRYLAANRAPQTSACKLTIVLLNISFSICNFVFQFSKVSIFFSNSPTKIFKNEISKIWIQKQLFFKLKLNAMLEKIFQVGKAVSAYKKPDVWKSFLLNWEFQKMSFSLFHIFHSTEKFIFHPEPRVV